MPTSSDLPRLPMESPRQSSVLSGDALALLPTAGHFYTTGQTGVTSVGDG